MDIDFGKNLREARNKARLTQEQLTIMSGVKGIAHYENNDRKPSLDTLISLSKALNRTIDSLIYPKKTFICVCLFDYNKLIDKAYLYDKIIEGIKKTGEKTGE